MKKIFIYLTLLLTLNSFSQTPDGINYQAVIRNSSGFLVTNTLVNIRLNLIQDSINGAVLYSEKHIVTTNSNGYVNLILGHGTVLLGSFSTINWANGPYFVETAVDLNNSGTFVFLGNQQLMSVPYALYAVNSGTPGPQGVSGTNGLDGKSTLINTSVETNGVNCPNGGIKLEVGLDNNNNGILDSIEINGSMTKYICNGEKGLQGLQGISGTNGVDGKKMLVNTVVEPSGINCVNGGIKIEFGLDSNNNDSLDIVEVNNNLTKFVCNGLGNGGNVSGIGNHGSIILGAGQNQSWTVPQGVTFLHVTIFSSVGGSSGQICVNGWNCAWPCNSGPGGNYIGATFFFNSTPGQIFGLTVGNNGSNGSNVNSTCSGPGSPGTDGTDAFITVNGIELIRCSGGKGGSGAAGSCGSAPPCGTAGANGQLIYNQGTGLLQLQSTIGGTLFNSGGPNLIKIEY